MVISKAPESSVTALCSPGRAGPRATTTASGSGACVAASTTIPVRVAVVVCAAAEAQTANVNASTARRIDPVFTAKKSSRIASDDKKSSLELREDGPLHQIRRQQALRQDRVVKSERFESAAELLLCGVAQLEKPQVTVVVGRRLRRRPEGVAVYLGGGERLREPDLLLQELARGLGRPLAHLQLGIDESAHRALEPQLQGDQLAVVGHVRERDRLRVQTPTLGIDAVEGEDGASLGNPPLDHAGELQLVPRSRLVR